MLIFNWLIKKTLQQKGRKFQEGELDLQKRSKLPLIYRNDKFTHLLNSDWFCTAERRWQMVKQSWFTKHNIYAQNCNIIQTLS